MSRMHYLIVALLLVVATGATWYATREITRRQDRVEALTGRLNDALARADSLGDRVRELESTRASAPTSRPVAGDVGASVTGLSTIGVDRLRNFGGLEAVETQMAIIANNMANANTPGFKRQYVVFENNGQGMGSRLACTRHDMSAGPVVRTNRALDVMIEGEGFFQVRTQYRGEEIVAYTRAGNFSRDAYGSLILCNSEGSFVEPQITLGENDQDVEITSDGMVAACQSAGPQRTQIGQVELARFINPDGLKAIGKNLYVETEASGGPITGNPGEDGLGTLISHALEGSNVSIERERVDMAFAQRAFDVNSQYLQGLAYRTALASPTPPVIPIPQPTRRDSR